jgi:hypothetical protein
MTEGNVIVEVILNNQIIERTISGYNGNRNGNGNGNGNGKSGASGFLPLAAHASKMGRGFLLIHAVQADLVLPPIQLLRTD